MEWTPNGYRYPLCVACQVAVRMGIRNKVDKGRCRIRGIGEVCGQHYKMLTSVMTAPGGSST